MNSVKEGGDDCWLGWSDFHFFTIFENVHIAVDWLYFMSSIPKNQQILPRTRAAHARQSFNIQKITET